MDHDEEFLASVDDDGNTILDLAADFKHSKVFSTLMEKEQATLDMAENKMPIRATMHQILIDSTGTTVPPNHMKKSNNDFRGPISQYIKKSVATMLQYYDNKWVETMSGWLIIVAILVATVAFQAGVQPPGGVWPNDNSATGDKAGSAVAARNGNFFVYNSLAFLSSLSVILLLVSGAPVHNRCCTWVLVLFMWATLTFMTLTYSATMYVVNPPPTFNVTVADPSYVFSLPDQDRPNIPTLSIWFLVLGGVLLYQLLVMLVWLSDLLYRFTLYLRSSTSAAPVSAPSN